MLNCILKAIKKTWHHPKADEEKRQLFQERIAHYKEEGRPLIYLDESGFAQHMPRKHGYSSKGQRCYGLHAWGERGRINVIGALLGTQLLTVSLFEGSINTATFNSWIEQDLVPKLPPNSVVILDNATFHKDKKMQDNLFQAGVILEYLPPYSPGLNPIEHKWAQAKAIRRIVKLLN